MHERKKKTFLHVCVYVWVCVRERKSVCVCVRERKSVCVCQCDRYLDVGTCVCEWERENRKCRAYSERHEFIRCRLCYSFDSLVAVFFLRSIRCFFHFCVLNKVWSKIQVFFQFECIKSIRSFFYQEQNVWKYCLQW